MEKVPNAVRKEPPAEKYRRQRQDEEQRSMAQSSSDPASYSPPLEEGAVVGVDGIQGVRFKCQRVSRDGGGMLQIYLAVTPLQLLELQPHRTRMNQVVVLSAASLQSLARVKFHKGKSVTLIFKTGGSVEFFMREAIDCVKAVKRNLQALGVTGTQTSARVAKKVAEAKGIMGAIQRQVDELSVKPTMEQVQIVMDLHKQATERYVEANSDRYKEVMNSLHTFLSRADVNHILGGEEGPPPPPAAAVDVPPSPPRPPAAAPLSPPGAGGVQQTAAAAVSSEEEDGPSPRTQAVPDAPVVDGEVLDTCLSSQGCVFDSESDDDLEQEEKVRLVLRREKSAPFPPCVLLPHALTLTTCFLSSSGVPHARRLWRGMECAACEP